MNTVASTFGTFTEKELSLLKSSLRELSDVYTMIEAEKDTEKGIIDRANEELSIPKSLIRRLAKTYHKKNYSSVSIENEEFALLYEGVVGESNS